MISPKEHREFWKTQRESTQYSPSGLYFGFMTATAKDDKLCATISRLVSIPYESGYSPDRLRNSINVQVPKEDGAFGLEKQRCIYFLESSFYEGTKIIFSRRKMRHARAKGAIPMD